MKLLMLLLIVVSCAHKKEVADSYTVVIDSISAPKAAGKTFAIISGDKSIANNDLRFQEFAKITEKALIADGFVPSSSPEVKILLTYGIGDPISHTETRSVPVYGSTTSNVANAWGQNIGSVQTWGHKGFRTNSEHITNYKRTAVLRAVSAKSGDPLWETVITSSGTTGDLRRVFPYMLYGGIGHFGTSNKDKHIVYEDNAKANALKP